MDFRTAPGGDRNHVYPLGSPKLAEHYQAGRLDKSILYRPDGSIFEEVSWREDRVNVKTFLADDGSIMSKIPFKFFPDDNFYKADGVATYYRPDGTIKGTIEFRNGREAKSDWDD